MAATRRAVERLAPGVERVYLVYHRHAIAAKAAGNHDEARLAALEAHRLLETTLEGLGAREREGAVERVPEHREIVAVWTGLSPVSVQVRLPAVGTPTGRPLGEDELRQITWTVADAEDDLVASPIDRRRHLNRPAGRDAKCQPLHGGTRPGRVAQRWSPCHHSRTETAGVMTKRFPPTDSTVEIPGRHTLRIVDAETAVAQSGGSTVRRRVITLVLALAAARRRRRPSFSVGQRHELIEADANNSEPVES